MKYLPASFFAACLLLCLTACTSNSAESEAVETDWTVRQMAAALWESGSQLGGTELLPGDTLYENYLTAGYGLDPAQIADGVIWAAGGTSAQEVAVFQLAGDGSGDAAVEALQSYLESRAGAFTGYLPEEAALLERAEVISRGDYVALLACEDLDAARGAFARCFTEAPPAEPAKPSPSSAPTSAPSPSPSPAGTAEPSPSPTPTPTPVEVPEATSTQTAPASMPAPASTPGSASAPAPQSPSPAPSQEPWSYDSARLLSAWAAGEWSRLAEEDQAILDICQEVISTVVPADGSDYDRELAVHDWMIAHGRYDSNTLSQLPDFQENPNNDNPYGFLVDGVGICLGYARTFQLFMDLLNIPCITVEGTSSRGSEAHAWNQVCLDGAWYCVDVTWDDPTTRATVSADTAHRFFNVTSAYMRETDHQWEEAAVPEAAGTAYAWN